MDFDRRPGDDAGPGSTVSGPLPQRHSLRLREYDYSREGACFITVCTQGRACLFGEIADGDMQLTDAGVMIRRVWDEIPDHYAGVDIDAFVVMPNHIHGIIILTGDGRPVGASPRACPDFAGPPDAQSRNNVGAGPCACPITGQPQGVAPTGEGMSLPDVVHRFKSMTTKRYAEGVQKQGWRPFHGKLWQRNYWEHIVRNERELDRIREYILHNPARWSFDDLYVGV